ncbi:MAG: hypothetical protein AB1650_08340 [Candidatus Omnitrophota bacterium]
MYHRFLLFIMMGLLAGMIVSNQYDFYAQEVAEEVVVETVEKTVMISGKIAAVDIEKSMITVVEASQAEGQEAAEIVFLVVESTEIDKEGESVTLAGLTIGDSVSVEYETQESGENIAQSIWLN